MFTKVIRTKSQSPMLLDLGGVTKTTSHDKVTKT
jgi:hypothetical protein